LNWNRNRIRRFWNRRRNLLFFRNDDILEERFNRLEAKVHADQEQLRTELQVTRVILFNLMYYNALTRTP
jgi:hypothetical protein